MSSFLQKHSRQPKLYIDLPSNGRYYPDGVLVDGMATNLPVFGMTANDEIMIKTPDALFAGEATVQVIKNCIPNITNPWKMPTIDIDHCLIAIRMATYGNNMPMSTKCPKCGTENQVDLNLNVLIEQASSKVFQSEVQINDLTFLLNPLDYETQTSLQKRLYETQRQISSIPKEWSDEEKQTQVTKLLKASTVLQVETIMSFVEKITDGDNEETSQEEIQNFLTQGDAVYFNKLKEIVEKIRKDWDKKVIENVCTNEECKEVFNFSVTLDYANFFAPRS
jgi:hypothetical protein